MRFKPMRVIAFDKRGAPMKNVKWQVEFNRRKKQLVLRRWFSIGGVKSFDLTKDVVYFDEQRETTAPRESISVARTLGRMYLTGLAADKMRQGKFGGAALMDLSIRGAARTKTAGYTWVYAMIGFQDTSVIHVTSATESEWASLAACIGTQQLVSQHDAALMVDEVKRYSRDGVQVLAELDSDLEALASQLDDASKEVRTGANFAERDAARSRLEFLEQECERRKALITAVRWELGVSLTQGIENAKDSTKAAPSLSDRIVEDLETTASDDGAELLPEDIEAAVKAVLAREIGRKAVVILRREFADRDSTQPIEDFYIEFLRSPPGTEFTSQVFAELSETGEIDADRGPDVLGAMILGLISAMKGGDA